MMNKYFDKIYCINTIGDDVRWNNIISEFSKIGLDINDVEKVSEPFPDDLHPYASLNDVWIKIVKDAKDKNYEKILILEDDVEFVNIDMFSKFTEDLENYDKNWDLFYLGGIISLSETKVGENYLNLKCSTYLKKFPKHLSRLTSNLVEINNGYVGTTHSVAIKNTIFDEIMKFSNLDNRDGKNEETDNVFGTDTVLQQQFQKPDEYNTYLAFPAITKSMPNISNLEKGKKQDFKELTTPLYRALLKVKPLNEE